MGSYGQTDRQTDRQSSDRGTCARAYTRGLGEASARPAIVATGTSRVTSVPSKVSLELRPRIPILGFDFPVQCTSVVMELVRKRH